MAQPDSAQLAREAKTFTTNASRTPETMALISRALVAYEAELHAWLACHHTARVGATKWVDKYGEWRVTCMTLKALGVKRI